MKTKILHKKTWIAPLTLLAVSAITGCAASTTVKAPEAAIGVTKDATKESLLAAYNHAAAGITSLNLSIDLVPSAGKAYSGIIQQYHEVNAFILAKRPADVRMIGQVLSKNIFDMTSDGETFHIFIPSKNKFMVGSATLERPAEKPIENIRPQHLLDALFWSEIPAGASVVIAEDDELAARYYVLSVLTKGASPEIERNLWFDRSDLHLARIQIYGAAGKLASDIRLDEWQSAAPAASTATVNGSLEFPRHITMQRPHDDYKLEIKVKKLALNESIADDRFQLQQPPGTELVKVGESGAGTEQ
jgi:outer membrane lipoprotein-sorting protein|nr:hypothetical protein [Candidatus Acidoferrales bacterium]